MSDAPSSLTSCLNCGSTLTGNYCQECGQSAKVKRISFKETIDDFFSSTFALEGPLLFTLRSLIVNPGRMFRGFIGGKRKTYYKPVAFFIVLTAFYLIIQALIGYDPLEGQFQPDTEKMHPRARMSMEAARYMVSHINHIMLILVFGMALNMKLFFRKRYNYTEYLIMAFYITGIYILYGSAMMVMEKYVVDIPKTLWFGFLVLYIGYLSRSLFQSASFWAYCKYVLIGIFSVVFYIIVGFGVCILIVSI